MRVTARNIAIAVLSIFAVARADSAQDALDAIANAASALTDDDDTGFMSAFDKSMPGYETLRGYIGALIVAADVTSSIEPVKNQGDDSKRALDLDWILNMKSREPAGPSLERHQTVHCELVKEKKHWRITAITPLDFFAPPKFKPSL